jgi:cyclase
MFLDITASSEKRGLLLDVISRTAEVCFMPVSVGGGVREVADMRRLLLAGADKVSTNTAAVENPDLIAAGADAFGASAWSWPSTPSAIEYAIEVAALGAGEILLTSMDRDGTRDGFDLALTRAIADAVPIPVIASGGVGALDHFVDGVLEGHASAVLAASVFHFGQFTIGEVKTHMAAAGIPVRLDG